MDKKTVIIIAKNPKLSMNPKRVPRKKEDKIVAVAGSMQPIKVALTGPINFTPCKNKEKPPAVPMTTIIIIITIENRSKLLGRFQT